MKITEKENKIKCENRREVAIATAKYTLNKNALEKTNQTTKYETIYIYIIYHENLSLN